MVNINQSLVSSHDATVSLFNRGFQYGDAVFETLRVIDGKIVFWEDHYFRLMASMRILRMEIPMNFTLEFLQEEVLKTVASQAENPSHSWRVKILVWRTEGGKYTPVSQTVSFAILSEPLPVSFYTIEDKKYEVELYKDHYVVPDLLSTLKSNNRIINVLGSIFANENGYDNCLLLNSDKKVIEALNGNIFLLSENQLKTPPLSDGCLNGIVRKQLIKIIQASSDFSITEASISPFELQKADALLITNTIVGIKPVTKYRKKQYQTSSAKMLLAKLNTMARLS